MGAPTTRCVPTVVATNDERRTHGTDTGTTTDAHEHPTIVAQDQRGDPWRIELAPVGVPLFETLRPIVELPDRHLKERHSLLDQDAGGQHASFCRR